MIKYRKRIKRSNRAFTLTELTVALAVSTVALIIVLTLSVIAVRTVQSSNEASAQLRCTYNAKELISDFFYSFDSKDFSVETVSSSKVVFVSQSTRAEMEFSQGKLVLDGIETELDGGWCAVSYEGAVIGGGKISGGKIKNHYPKGLRNNK